MATFSAFMLFMGIAGMVGNIGASSINSQNKSNDLKQHIIEVQKNNAENKALYDQIVGDITIINTDLRLAYQDTCEKYIDLVSKIKYTQQEFNKSFRQLQVAGLILVVFVFFLLLLKQFGVLGYLGKMIEEPFIALWHKITGKKE